MCTDWPKYIIGRAVRQFSDVFILCFSQAAGDVWPVNSIMAANACDFPRLWHRQKSPAFAWVFYGKTAFFQGKCKRKYILDGNKTLHISHGHKSLFKSLINIEFQLYRSNFVFSNTVSCMFGCIYVRLGKQVSRWCDDLSSKLLTKLCIKSGKWYFF